MVGNDRTKSASRSVAAGRLDPPARLIALTDETYEMVMAAPTAVVLVTDGVGANSVRYLAEVRTMLAAGEMPAVRVAVLDRNMASDGRFGREHPWVARLRLLPYTLVLAHGWKVDEFATIRADVLQRRLTRLRTRVSASVTERADEERWDRWIYERPSAA